MKRWIHLVGAVVSLACIYFFVRAIHDQFSSFDSVEFGPAVLVPLVSAGALYVLTYISSTQSWRLMLALLGTDRDFLSLCRVLMTSQLAKYLPGNVGHHIGRVLLARQLSIPTNQTLASIATDTFLALAAGAICSIPASAILIDVLRKQPTPSDTALLLVLAGLLVLALLLRRQLLMALDKVIQAILALRGRGGAGKVLFALLCHISNFAAGATSLFVLCELVSSDPSSSSAPQWFSILGIYSAAWLAGFLVPGAPAGLGVRELVLYLGLGPTIGQDAAMIGAAGLRLVTTIGDGVAFLIALALPARQSGT